jgi:hypothetical protein
MAAARGRVYVAQRTQLVHTWEAHEGTILQMLVMEKLLLSLGSDGYLRIWQIDIRSSSPLVRYLKVVRCDTAGPCDMQGHLACHIMCPSQRAAV